MMMIQTDVFSQTFAKTTEVFVIILDMIQSNRHSYILYLRCLFYKAYSSVLTGSKQSTFQSKKL